MFKHVIEKSFVNHMQSEVIKVPMREENNRDAIQRNGKCINQPGILKSTPGWLE